MERTYLLKLRDKKRPEKSLTGHKAEIKNNPV